MRDETRDSLILLLVSLLVLFAAIGTFGTRITWPVIEESAWPESAEFSQIESGADRFSEHATNLEGVVVLVDHETGVQYARSASGMCPLIDADGTPLLVAGAGE